MARFSGVAAGTVPANTNVLVSTTLPKLQKTVIDQFFSATPFLWFLREQNRVKPWEGGDTLEIPLLFNENVMAKDYQSYETMDLKPPEGITTSIWGMVHYRVPIMYSRSMAAANRGASAIVDLIGTLRDQARLSLSKYINTDLFVESGFSTTKINSIYHLVEEVAPASQAQICGGIDKGTYTWWRSQYLTATSAEQDAGRDILYKIRELYVTCGDGADTPDLALCDDYTYINLEQTLQTAVRFVNPRAVDWGFENVTYKGMTIFFDKSINDDAANGDGDGSLFMLNTKYLNLYIGTDANFRIVPPEWDFKQDAFVGGILVDLQLVCTQMRRQGALTGGAYAAACY
jgi:hypothetical protein